MVGGASGAVVYLLCCYIPLGAFVVFGLHVTHPYIGVCLVRLSIIFVAFRLGLADTNNLFGNIEYILWKFLF